MTSRSIVLGTAALLLVSVVVPTSLGFSATAVMAQGASAKVAEALAGNPARLDAKQLREAINVLREAIESRALRGGERRAAQDKIKAYEKALKQQSGEPQQAQQAQQEPQADRKAEQQARKAEQQARKAEQQAHKEERKAEQQARKAERKTEQNVVIQQAQPQQRTQQAQPQQRTQQAQPQQQTQQVQRQRSTERTRTEQAAPVALSPAMAAALNDRRPSSALDPAELRNRIQTLRDAVQSGVLSRDQRRQAQQQVRADRQALETSQTARKEPTTTQKPATRAESTRTREMPTAEVERTARTIMADNTPAERLSDEDLRKRLNDNRAILGTGKLSRAEERQLRNQLRDDRDELRTRVASRQEEMPRRRGFDSQTTGSQGASRPRATTESRWGTTPNVSIIIEQRTPSDRLSDRELEQRVRVLSRALKEERIARRDAELALHIVEQDRRELRRRLHAGRDWRREERRRARSRNEIFIDFNIGYRPPPVIFAAEAMPRDIEVQLIAPPLRQVSRAYSFQEIYADDDVREMMPGIEIDTLNFDFGSAEVRPEEIDKLDDIAEVIERIVAARPDEVFALEGNTDAVGSHEANDALSLRRARAVAEALVDYYDIDPANLRTVGLGKRFLKIMTPDPEEENRRVTVRRITPLLVGQR